MAVAGAAKRYARAAFDLAKQQNSVDEWESELHHLLALVQNPVVAEFFESPAVPESAKSDSLVQELPGEARQYIRNFALLLLERGRLHQLPDIVEEFDRLVLEDRGIAIADVTTAVSLTDQEASLVERRVEQIISKKVQMRPHVDPDIIGGVVVRIGDMLIDGSVQTQLRALRQQMAR